MLPFWSFPPGDPYLPRAAAAPSSLSSEAERGELEPLSSLQPSDTPQPSGDECKPSHPASRAEARDLQDGWKTLLCAGSLH